MRAQRHSSTDTARSRRRGLTLLEVMVVVVILGLLATAVVINVTGHLSRGKSQRVLMDLATLRDGVEFYKLEFETYPTSSEGLKALLTKTQNYPNGILSAVPKDPWGKPYLYQSPAGTRPYDILCLGRDGREGGEGEDADLSLDDLHGRDADEE